MMNEFITSFDINDITNLTWKMISERLKHKINISSESVLMKNSKIHINGIQIQYDKSKEFDGIFNYLRIHSQGNFNSEISISSSSIYKDNKDYSYDNICILDNSKVFCSKSKENSWIKIHFNSNKIIPYHYTIKSSHQISFENYNMKSWVLEGSIDDEHWIILDERNDVESLKDSNAVQTFSIQNWKNIEFQYLRLRQTSNNWRNSLNLNINSIEFFRSLISI